MARGQDGKKQPEVGDVFAFPIGKQRYSFCWVARKTRPEYLYSTQLKKFLDVPYLVIACADFVGSKPPTADEIVGRTLLRLTTDGCKKEACVRMDSCAPPRGFVKVGRMAKPGAPSAKDNYSGFTGIQREAKRQWQWDHERGKLLADDVAEARAEAAAEVAAEKALKTKLKRRKQATLARVGLLELLPDWDGLVSASHRSAVEKLLRELCVNLRAARDRDAKLAAIEATVGKVNRWNDRTGVIATEEREALATAIDELGHKAGLRGRDLAGDFRDW
ncbi:MAG: hypothetical protein H0T79_14570 [Deltaproteobacteria bacterium]|nr:hypothetical protein [Deltaproteobacteria bacterium]